MTTATKVDKKWDTKKTQETTSEVLASMYVSAIQVLTKVGGKAHEEFNKLLLEHKVNHYKKLGVKNPLELVHAIGETEHNLFGSEVEITGDDKRATIKWNSCGMWNACEKLHKFSDEEQKAMGDHCMGTWKNIADQFGFKFEPSTEKDVWAMTFSK